MGKSKLIIIIKQILFNDLIWKLQAKIKQRNVILNKCKAIQNICGKHLKDPIYSSEDEKDSEEVDKKEEIKNETSPKRNKTLSRFRDIVKRIIDKYRCEKIIEAVNRLKEEKEFYEKNCFQFADNDEHFLYRKFLNHWQARFDILRSSKARSMSMYYQPTTSSKDDDESLLSTSTETLYTISPTITITDSQECIFIAQ